MKATLTQASKPHKNREIEQRFCPHMNANVVLAHMKGERKTIVLCLDSYNCSKHNCLLHCE